MGELRREEERHFYHEWLHCVLLSLLLSLLRGQTTNHQCQVSPCTNEVGGGGGFLSSSLLSLMFGKTRIVEALLMTQRTAKPITEISNKPSYISPLRSVPPSIRSTHAYTHPTSCTLTPDDGGSFFAFYSKNPPLLAASPPEASNGLGSLNR